MYKLITVFVVSIFGVTAHSRRQIGACATKTCGTNETCYISSAGQSECRCDKGKTCLTDRHCIDLANNGDCEFYNCFENRRNCGPNGYMIGYGGKYCHRFGQHYDSFNALGRTWIDCARKCLTKALIQSYQANQPAGYGCSNVTSLAFHTHVDCYHDCGFCNIWNSNKLALLSVYQLGDFLAQRALSQVFEVAKKCLQDYIVG